MTNATEQTPHDCYWCRAPIQIYHVGEGPHWLFCDACHIETKTYPTRASLVEYWNSLASRLKPEPKKVTVKRWVNVYPYCMPPGKPQEYFVPEVLYENRAEAEIHRNNLKDCIDTVEVEITFTDRRGCE